MRIVRHTGSISTLVQSDLEFHAATATGSGNSMRVSMAAANSTAHQSPLHQLPTVAREVGNDLEVMIDTGIMHGADIVASIALGARFTLIGRAYLYGLMAGGRRGVDRTIAILRDEIERTMKLLQVENMTELTPAHVTQLSRMRPVPRELTEAAK